MLPIEMALETALLVIQNGGSTGAADRSLANILKGWKTDGVSVIWRLDFVAVTTTVEGRSSTSLRSVGPIGVNLVRAAAATLLAERVAQGDLDVAAVGTEIARIRNLPAPYNRAVMTAAAACAGAAFSQVSGGDWGSLAIAFVAAGAGQLLRSALQARKVAVAPVTLMCGALSAGIAAIGLRFGVTQTAGAALIASVIYVVPGLPLINGFIDVASHKHLFVGIQRIANATFLFVVIAFAIVLALTVFV